MPRSISDRVLESFSNSKKKLKAKTICNNENGSITEYTEGGRTIAFRFEYPDGRGETRIVSHDYTRDLEEV